MTLYELVKNCTEFLSVSPLNAVSAEDAIRPELAGMKIYEAPLFGVASAEDPLFTDTFKQEGVIHPNYRSPGEWLPGAGSVISFFLPFTQQVRESNRKEEDVPYEEGLPQRCSDEWLHARIEGQILVDAMTDNIRELLEAEGFRAVCPSTSVEFAMVAPFVPNWSERHAAYAAGLGTFGLSKGLITEKGMAGRIGSVITDAVFPATIRPYSGPFDYCIMCGICQKRCPSGAIDIKRGCALGKDHQKCSSYLRGGHLPEHGPNRRRRYGCGKCQVAVPCESRIPKKPVKSELSR